MRRFMKAWGVSGAAWLGVLVIAGAAIAASLESPDVQLRLSPKGAMTEKTIDSDEPFEMTLHLQGGANETYSLAVSYGDDAIGTCADAEGPITLDTNPQGKAVWTCVLDTAANEGEENLTGTVNFAVSSDDSVVGEMVATISVRPAEEEEEEEEQEEEEIVEEDEEEEEEEQTEGEGKVNHGHCVSFWAHESKAQGLKGKWKGAFISSIARDKSAVAPKTERGGDPGGECDFQDELDDALEQMEEDQAARLAEREAKAADREARKSGGSSKGGKKNRK